MRKLDSFPVGPLQCNCSLLWDANTGNGIVVDPGGDGAKILARVEAAGFRVVALLHTHAHFDHVGATKELQELWQCPAFLHDGDTFLIENPNDPVCRFRFSMRKVSPSMGKTQ